MKRAELVHIYLIFPKYIVLETRYYEFHNFLVYSFAEFNKCMKRISLFFKPSIPKKVQRKHLGKMLKRKVDHCPKCRCERLFAVYLHDKHNWRCINCLQVTSKIKI